MTSPDMKIYPLGMTRINLGEISGVFLRFELKREAGSVLSAQRHQTARTIEVAISEETNCRPGRVSKSDKRVRG